MNMNIWTIYLGLLSGEIIKWQAIFERDEDLQRIFASPDGLSTEALTMERYAEPRQTHQIWH